MTVDQALFGGLEHYNAGRLREAEQLFRQALSAAPDHPDGLNLLGLVAFQTKHYTDALALIGRAVEIAPGYAEYRNNLGEVLRYSGQIDKAIEHYRAAIRLNDSLASAHFNLGNVLWEKRAYVDAERHLTRTIELRADDPAAFNNLGEVLRAQGKYDLAAAACQRAIELAPHLGVAYCNLGKVMKSVNRNTEAIELMRKAVELQPDHAGVVGTLANAMQSVGRPSEAVEIYDRAIAIDPLNTVLPFNRAGALRLQGRVDESISAYRDALSLNPNNAAGHSSLLLTMHCSSSITPEELFNEHLIWASRHEEGLSHEKGVRPLFDHQATNPRPERLRIGYVSPDFHVHPIGWFIDAALRLNREQFEVFVFADELRSDEVTARLKSIVGPDRWRNVMALDDAQLADQVRADKIDILIDLAGHTADNRLLTFARNPAPVQATYLGYPNTTGMSAMGFRITDTHADPIGQTESLHSENLIRLPVCNWCYAPTDEVPVPQRDASTGAMTFGSFNGLQKVSTAAIELWSRVLGSVPESRLLMKSAGLEDPAIRKRVQTEFAKHGVDPARLELFGTVSSIAAHLSMYARIDVALDTFPYTGTTTTCEALWMGVPVVTLAGRTHVSRVGVSLLTAAGLPDLIAQSPEEYLTRAPALARDTDRLRVLRQTLRDQLRQSALTDSKRFAGDFADACRAMWAASVRT